jgi:hypothetical protein
MVGGVDVVCTYVLRSIYLVFYYMHICIYNICMVGRVYVWCVGAPGAGAVLQSH